MRASLGVGCLISFTLRTPDAWSGVVISSKLAMRAHALVLLATADALSSMGRRPVLHSGDGPVVEWMWADSGTPITRKLAKKNPLRWTE